MLDLINVSYDTQIPNNVGLSDDRKVLKALEKWHPGYIDWWNKLIPRDFQDSMVYLRTAVSVDPKGWAKFDYVRMPEYRWGVLLAPQVDERLIPFSFFRSPFTFAVKLKLSLLFPPDSGNVPRKLGARAPPGLS